jgi:hypothetical protein
MQKSHRDQQVRRVHTGASCPPIAREHPLDFFVRCKIAPSRACFDDLPFLFADVVVSAPLFHFADETRDLLLFLRRPAQHPVEDFFDLISGHIGHSTISAIFRAISASLADLNLGITTYVNGAPMNPVQLDTSAVATDTKRLLNNPSNFHGSIKISACPLLVAAFLR